MKPLSVEINDHLKERGGWEVQGDDTKAHLGSSPYGQVLIQTGVDSLSDGVGVGEHTGSTSEGEEHSALVSSDGRLQVFMDTLPLPRNCTINK